MTVLAGQLPAFFGFFASGVNFYYEVNAFVAGVMEERTNSMAIPISVLSTVVI